MCCRLSRGAPSADSVTPGIVRRWRFRDPASRHVAWACDGWPSRGTMESVAPWWPAVAIRRRARAPVLLVLVTPEATRRRRGDKGSGRCVALPSRSLGVARGRRRARSAAATARTMCATDVARGEPTIFARFRPGAGRARYGVLAPRRVAAHRRPRDARVWRCRGVAGRVGFEPTIPLPVCRFSRPEHSTALPPARMAPRHRRGGGEFKSRKSSRRLPRAGLIGSNWAGT